MVETNLMKAMVETNLTESKGRNEGRNAMGETNLKHTNLKKRVCCLLVLNLVSSTLSCIRQPRPRLASLGRDSTKSESESPHKLSLRGGVLKLFLILPALGG